MSKPEQIAALNQANTLVKSVLVSLPTERFRGVDQLRAAVMDAEDAIGAAIMDLETQREEGEPTLF